MRMIVRLLLPLAAVGLATPAAAQSYSEHFTFLDAVRKGDGPTVQRIVSNPSSSAVNSRDPRTGEGALHMLVRQRNLQFLAYLLAHGARPDLADNDGNTALGVASQVGWTEGATQLLARGANVNLANNRGETPLILAVQASHRSITERLEIVRLLLSQGADPNRQDSSAGYSALDYARRDSRSPELVRVLEAGPPRRGAGAMGPNR